MRHTIKERLSPASPRKVDEEKVHQSEQKVLEKKKAAAASPQGSHVPPAGSTAAAAAPADSGYAPELHTYTHIIIMVRMIIFQRMAMQLELRLALCCTLLLLLLASLILEQTHSLITHSTHPTRLQLRVESQASPHRQARRLLLLWRQGQGAPPVVSQGEVATCRRRG